MKKNSLVAMLASAFVVLAAVILVVLPRLPSATNCERDALNELALQLAAWIWKAALALTAVSVLFAAFKRCTWRWPLRAMLLCTLLPVACVAGWTWSMRKQMLLKEVGMGNQRIVTWCLRAGFDVNSRATFRNPSAMNTWFHGEHTPLTMAIKMRQPAMVQLLLKHGADVNCVGGESRTPLWWTMHVGDFDLMQLLLDRGAIPSAEMCQWAKQQLKSSTSTAPTTEDSAKRQKVLAFIVEHPVYGCGPMEREDEVNSSHSFVRPPDHE